MGFFRYLNLVIIICFHVQFSRASDIVKLWRRIELSDILVSAPSRSTFTRSLAMCAEICLQSSPVCKTFGYNKGDKSCLIFTNRVFAKGSVISTSPGLRYYWTYADSCPSGYSYYPSMQACLKVTKRQFFVTNWYHNHQKCVDAGGYLFIPDTNYKRLYIETVIADQGKPDGDFCVGGGDTLVEGTYFWLDGSSINDTLYSPGQPDDYGGEDCSIINQDGGVYKLFDDNCRNIRNYICEIPMK